MALNAHLKIVAEKQGAILGSVTQKGREGSIQVIAAMHEIVSPRDPASGRPTGKRVHKPFVVTKVLDRSTPLLYSVLCNNENIKSFELQFYTPHKNGIEKQHYTVRLENANISSIIFRMPSTRSKIAAQLPEREEVAFTYQKIIWTWNEGGITADDDWETPR
ncbi:Hcp family type VI secretion system effector [Polyangium spumosum]|uniref:Type VI secretion system tube protein Hcp n=1 Tax=Polyangium spumosum TaxID=889282 RepID=A0A6N7PNV5_9BACT|nr:Hcp family type VI secretion system effector [Polyangium spumosum]MRG93357.1 type VI secretion system tube protein Hcp [Polyangium spumosum]